MNEFNVHLLLEEKWRSIRHIETERHWILAAYSVVVAGVLSFLGQNQDGSVIPIFAFTILLVLAIFGFLHACRAAWQLGQIQFETREIVGLWQTGIDPLPEIDALMEFWAFGGHGPQFREGFYGFWVFLLSLFTGWSLDDRVFHLFSFNTIYAWIYLLVFGVWVGLLVK